MSKLTPHSMTVNIILNSMKLVALGARRVEDDEN